MKDLGAEGSGCSPVVHLGLIEHPNLDPQFWAVSSTLRTVREAASADCLSALLEAAPDPDSVMPRYSLTALLVDRLHLLGWTFEGGVSVSDALGTFSLLRISFPELLLRMTWAWTKVVESAVQHRSSFAGLGECDPFALLQALTVEDQGLYCKALNGAHFTQDAICHWSTSGSTVCPFCGSEDSRRHRFWACPVFASECQRCTPDFWELLDHLPSSVTLHGWAYRPTTSLAWYRCLIEIQVPDMSLAPCPLKADDGWLDVFTDGSRLFENCCMVGDSSTPFRSCFR